MAKKFVYDKGIEVKTGEGKNIIYSVFFDGTQNNKTNTEIGEERRKKIVADDELFYKDYMTEDDKVFPILPQAFPSEPVITIDGGTLEEVFITPRKGDSYENDYTNVARLFYSYNHKETIHERIYIEGVGTEDNGPDDMAAVGIGVFSTSVRGKAKKAVDQIFNKVALIVGNINKLEDKFIDNLTIDVYGFSRGATTARYFTHFMTTSKKTETAKYYEYHNISDLLTPIMTKFKALDENFYFLQSETLTKLEKFELSKIATAKTVIDLEIIAAKLASVAIKAYSTVHHDYFKELLKKENIKVNHLNIRFLGLFDTVSSYGLFHDNDVKDLGLDAVNKAQRTVHLAAADEYRKNFALTNIKNAGFRGIELTLPGVHCDIGGAYNTAEYEKTAFYITSLYDEIGIAPANLILGPVGSIIKEAFEPNARKFRKNLIKEGWIKEDQAQFIYKNWLGGGMKGLQSMILTGVIQTLIKSLNPSNPGTWYLKKINNKMLQGLQIGLPPFGILYGHRILSNKYSFIPLNMMADFSKELGVPINREYFTDQGWVVPADLREVNKALHKYKNKIVDLRAKLKKEHDDEEINKMRREGILEHVYGELDDLATSDKQKKYLKASGNISYKDYLTNEEQLHYLRNNYLHWSAKSDSFGLDPGTRSNNFENRREIYNDS